MVCFSRSRNYSSAMRSSSNSVLLLLLLIVMSSVVFSYRIILPSWCGISTVAMKSTNGLPNFAEDDPLANMPPIYNPDAVTTVRTLMEPTFADMKEMAFLLANVTEHLDTQPELAMTVASQRMGWLYSRDVPKLTQMLLQEFPSFREDQGMMRAYMFLIDFLEAVVTETSSMQKTNQKLLRLVLEGAKVSEQQLDLVIQENRGPLTRPEFLLYLDAEIDNQDYNSPLENMLITTKLRLLDEVGKGMGIDVMVLPKLAAEENPAELRRKVCLLATCDLTLMPFV